MPQLQEHYRVTLDAFQGPLDLLLFLIRRAEVDITDIPLAAITDQYLAVLSQVDEVDVELAGEFLVMAATLIELKSRTLMPVEATGEEADDGGGARAAADPRLELVQQLLAYQRVRNAAEALGDRRREFALRFPRRPGREPRPEGGDEDVLGEGAEIEIELEDAHAVDLADAYERIMASIDFTRLGDHVVEMDDTPIALHQEDLLDRLRRTSAGRLTLQATFDGRPPSHRVGLFLATLELARTRRVSVMQEELDDPIELVLLAAEEMDEMDEMEAPAEPPAPSDR